VWCIITALFAAGNGIPTAPTAVHQDHGPDATNGDPIDVKPGGVTEMDFPVQPKD
jgi:hypothetical protein